MSLTCVGVAAALAVVDLAVPRPARAATILMFGALCMAANVVAVRHFRPAVRLPWYLLGVSTVLASLAVAIQAVLDRQALDLPLVSDALILLGLASWALASALFVRARTRVLDRHHVLDLGIFLVSGAVALKELVLEPLLDAHPPEGMSRGLSISFVLIELLCGVLFARLATLPGPRPPALWLLVAGLVTGVVGSVIANVTNPAIGLHLSLIASGTITLLAVVHPSMVVVAEPSPGERPSFGLLRSAGVGLALVLSPLSAAVVHARTGELHLMWFLLPTFVVTALVIVRLRLLFDRERDAQAEVERSRATFRALVHGISDVILALHRDGTIAYASASSATTLGLESDALLGKTFASLVDDADVATATAVVEAVWGSGVTAVAQVHIEVRDLVRVFEVHLTDRVDDPAVGGVVAVLHDATDRNLLESRLRHQALHDELTGLPNRALLSERLGAAVENDIEIGVLFVDLDDFKAVNDGLGHEVGDRLLCAVADRLRSAVRPGDTVARLGGDEFAILVLGAAPIDVAERLLESLIEPFEVCGQRIAVGASIGITSFGDNADELLRNADMAMYRAKSDGKGCLAVFQPGMEELASERLIVHLELGDALRTDQFRLLFQPMIQLATGRLVGAETLLRWQHPTRGLLTPDRFMTIAEETGLIIPIGAKVLDWACQEAASWPDDIEIAVNLSARQLEADDIVDTVRAALEHSGLPPERLVLEITETMLARDVEASAARLRRLAALGIRVAIDDFGTGYSSLSTITQFPVDVLKIDRSFIAQMVSTPEAAALVRVLVDMGRALKLQVIAEGIEHAEQAAALRKQQCDLGQGFYYSRPVTGEVFADLVRERAVVGS